MVKVVPSIDFRFDVDGAGVLFHNSINHGQAKPRAFHLRGEERFEYMGKDIVGDSLALSVTMIRTRSFSVW